MKIRQLMPPVRFALSGLNIALQEIVSLNLNPCIFIEVAKIVQNLKK